MWRFRSSNMAIPPDARRVNEYDRPELVIRVRPNAI
jgi:hypothetical protein